MMTKMTTTMTTDDDDDDDDKQKSKYISSIFVSFVISEQFFYQSYKRNLL